MDAELKAKWVAALRSGKYKQCKTFLRDGNERYCCLGVLADVAGLTISQDGDVILVDGKEARGYLPLSEIIGTDDLRPLWSRNDDGVPFTEIADYIEANL